MKKILMALGLAVAALSGTAASPSAKTDSVNPATLRLLYWNIQNGMWDGQPDNYDRFVEFVREQNPDICVWCEAATIYNDGTADQRAKELCYLPDNWGELAARYGHSHWYLGGYRDSYPQVITSRYPITAVDHIVGMEPDSVVSHGAGWAQIEKNGHTVNIVTLHTWPQRYSFHALHKDADARKASAAENGGDLYRRLETEYICRHTIGTSPDADRQLWMMMGDFNSKSVIDNYFYKMDPDSTAFLVHDYILKNTPYIDIIAEKYPAEFKSTILGKARIDFVYCTRPLFDRILHADVIRDSYTEPVRSPEKLSNFCHPSDHCPIVVDFDME